MRNGWKNIVALTCGALALLVAFLAWSTPVQAYSYVSTTISDLSVTQSTTALGATDNTITVQFTIPSGTSFSTSASFYINTPYLYNSTTSEYVDVASATITSDQMTVSSQYSSSVSMTPKTALTAGNTVKVTMTKVKNPAKVEGTGTFYVSGYEWNSAADTSTYTSGSVSQTYGTVNLAVSVFETNGTTGVKDVSVSLYYYNSTTYDYQSVSAVTDSTGKANFSGLVSGREYQVSFYHSTRSDLPASTTLKYSGGTTTQTQSYTVVSTNVLTYFKDKNGKAVANASWYFCTTNYTSYTTDYECRYGTTGSDGKISGAATKNGKNYTLSVTDPSTYSTYTYDFSVSSTGTVSGLASTVSIPSPEVSVTVKAGASAASSVYVSLHDSNWTKSLYGYTNTSGVVEFAVGKTGTYIIEVSSYGLPSGYFPPDSVSVSITAGVAASPITMNLQSATKTLNGTVKNGDGTAISDACIYAYQSSGNYSYASDCTDSNGAYSMTLSGGSWTLSVYQYSWPSTWAYTGASQTAKFANDSAVETQTVNYTVGKYDAHITGTLTYPTGTALGQNDGAVYCYGGEGNSVYNYAYTDASGNFDCAVAAGTYDVNFYFYGSTGTSNYSAPTVDKVVVASGETKSLGTLKFAEKTSHIQGKISNASTKEAVSGISVWAYKEGGSWDYASATTNSSGNYDLVVGEGDWSISIYVYGVQTSSGQELIYTGGSKSVKVAENETVTGQDFNLSVADSQFTFTTTDESGTTLDDQYGSVYVQEADGTGDQGYYGLYCYLSRGSCSVDVTSGISYTVSYYSYDSWNQDASTDSYTLIGLKSGGASVSSVSATASSTTAVSVVMGKNDVTISGNFEDSDGNAVTINGYVYASTENGGWAYANVYNASSYSLKLRSGYTWNINYATYDDNWYSYEKGAATTKYTPTANQTITLDFSVLERGATVSGQVLDSDGEPVTTPALVMVSTTSGTNETETEATYGHLEEQTYTDENGNFEMDMPEGDYYVTSFSTASDTQPVEVHADEEGSATDLALQFEKLDAEICGTITDGVGITVNKYRATAVNDPVVGATVWVTSATGNSNTATTDADGKYCLDVPNNITSTVGAYYETGTAAHYITGTDVDVDETTETLDTALTKTLDLVEPQSLQIDPNNGGALTLEDGAELVLPADSLTVDPDVTSVTVNMSATLTPPESHAAPLSYSYELTATTNTGDPITTLASQVTLTMPEPTVEGASSDDMFAGYHNGFTYETESGYIHDEDANVFTVSMDHFSSFSILSGQSVLATDDVSDDGSDDSSDADGDGIADSGILSAPEGLKITKRHANQVQLKWTAVESAASYTVDIINSKGKSVKTIAAKKHKKVVKKLTANKAYMYRVRSVGLTGTKSGWSDKAEFRTLPAAPKLSSLRVTQKLSDSVMVQWKKPRGKIQKYIVSIFNAKGKLIKTGTTKTTKAKIAGLQSGTAYSVGIQARFNKKNTSALSKKRSFTTGS